ncbi:endolytic transglycosylase MltG [Alkaliphilus transvaalensis]|uniref:endolytic transglycosylase MltG n=1 Tax=Alkaliphilus transvaalensis TaxID=114628 RepID=UPI00047BE20D|nr:endolytic transglycosylase MltG [Alkaliphilus transvaalensis]
MKKTIYMLICLIIVTSIAAFFLLPSYLSVASVDEPLEIVIPRGATMNYVTDLLYDNGVIRSKLWFKHQAKNAQVDRHIKPGTYVLSPNITMDEIFDLLIKGNAEAPIVLTIPEGFTLYQIAERVESTGISTIEEFLEVADAYFDEQDFSFDTADLYFNLEGYLYPDTYHFTESSTPQDVIRRLAKTMEDLFTPEYHARAEELGLSVHEILTLASLIEREAYHNDEKATISGVIYNRMKINMLLQIDATVIYGIGEGKEHITRVLYAHLEEQNPFNTYLVGGLPPGPIAAPSKSSIHAALYPEEHDYLYYVLGENGHVFGKTYQEHLKNVENYRRMMNR